MPRLFVKTILVFILFGASCFSQRPEFLKGKVLDSITDEPVVFATVRIIGKAKGVITNMDGGFRLPSRYRAEGELIEISSMGYQRKELPLLALALDTFNTIRLTPAVFELAEAVVSAKKKREPTARKIIRRAVARIPQNFPLTDFATKGYYRDYQLDDFGYLNLNEALLEVFDAGFDEIDTAMTKTRIYDYVQNKSFRRDSLADDAYNYMDKRKTIDNAYLWAYGGNEFAILRVHDAIRNYRLNSFDFINNMNKGNILRNHSFQRLSDTYSDEDELYKIQLKRTATDFTARGTMFVAKKDYAIHKLEYAVYDESKKNLDSLLQQKGIKGRLVFQVTTEYKRGKEDKMYLNYISFQNTFRLAEPPKFTVKNLTVLPYQGVFVVHFNNALKYAGRGFQDGLMPVGAATADRKFWYKFKYNDKKIRFRNIQIVNDSTVYLHPKMDSIPLNAMMCELVTMQRNKIDIGFAVKFTVSGLEDINGNTLNTESYKNYYQFREYFVQEVDNLPEIPADSLLMDKHKPIFSDQPEVRPDNFKDYWMNTPLRNTPN